MTRALVALALATALPVQALTDRSGPYELQLLVGGAPTSTFRHDGDTFVLGRLGDRYPLRVVNRSDRRVEAVVSVDGRDVIDGKPADWREKRGYLVPAFGSIDIDGWRISQQEAAAFRFSTVPRSYAARTGNEREVGIIGVAIFPERWYPPLRRDPLQLPPPAPWNGGPRSRLDSPQDRSEAPRGDQQAPAPAEPSAPAARHSKKSAERPGLGTEFGESVSSRVTEVPFQRAHRRPDVLLGARYDDHAGLAALGIDMDGSAMSEADLRRTADPFPVVERAYAQPPAGWRR